MSLLLSHLLMGSDPRTTLVIATKGRFHTTVETLLQVDFDEFA